MAIRSLLRFPDPRLKQTAAMVEKFDDNLRQLATDLLDTMRAAPGIGITAPHIGVGQRVVVLQLTADEPQRTYVNPVITWSSKEKIRHVEGSVSMPGVTDEIERHMRVRVDYKDVEGTDRTEEAEGLRAVCHQHEIDQLDGIFWIQRLSQLRRDRLIKRFRKLPRQP